MAAGKDADDNVGHATALLLRASQSAAVPPLAQKLALPFSFHFPFGIRLRGNRPHHPPRGRSRRKKAPSIRLGGGSSTTRRHTGSTGRSRFRFSLSSRLRRLRLRWLAAYYSRILLARLRSMCDAAARGLAEVTWGLQEAASGPTGFAESYGAAVPVVSAPFRPSYVLR